MKTRRLARAWVYRSVADSLRKHLNDSRYLPKGLTDAGLRRVQAEMQALAGKLETKHIKIIQQEVMQ